MMGQVIRIHADDVIKKRYKIRRTGAKNGRSIETSLPPEVFEREARRRGLTTDEAIEQLRVCWHYNSFTGLHLLFEERENNSSKIMEEDIDSTSESSPSNPKQGMRLNEPATGL